MTWWPVTDPDLIGLFIEPLEDLGIPYMITGGVASVIYGDPRFTRDIDIVLELDPAAVGRLARAFAGGDIYTPPREMLEEAAAGRGGGHFNLIHGETALRADIYLKRDDPLHAWAFGRRQRMSVEGRAIWVAPVEYVVLRKLEYYLAGGSDRHLRDVALMLRISGASIDWEELESWIARLDLAAAFDEARAYDPS